MREKSSYSKTSPFAITGMDNAATTSAISSHLAGSLGLSSTFLYLYVRRSQLPICFWYIKKQIKGVRTNNSQWCMYYYYLPCTASAGTPSFSILLANSTVSAGDFSRRILQVTGTSKFLLSVARICGMEKNSETDQSDIYMKRRIEREAIHHE